jgi:hypothetical protein
MYILFIFKRDTFSLQECSRSSTFLINPRRDFMQREGELRLVTSGNRERRLGKQREGQQAWQKPGA